MKTHTIQNCKNAKTNNTQITISNQQNISKSTLISVTIQNTDLRPPMTRRRENRDSLFRFSANSGPIFANFSRKHMHICRVSHWDLPLFADLPVFSVKRPVSCGLDCVDSGFLRARTETRIIIAI